MKKDKKMPDYRNDNSSQASYLFTRLLMYPLITIVILALIRIAFTVKFVGGVLPDNIGYLPRVMYNSLRFDLQTTAYVMILPTVLYLVSVFLPQSSVLRPKSSKITGFCRVYLLIAATLIALLGIIDIGFYQNFNSHINITFFDFFNEGPSELVVAIWQDYPVVWLFLALCLIMALVWMSVGYINKSEAVFCRGSKKLYAASFVYVVLLVVFMRGSVTKFPLQIEDTVVSPVERINDMIPNATYMLKKAWKDKKNAFVLKSADALLREYKFGSVQEALDIYTDKGVILSSDTLKSLHKALFKYVPDTAKAAQPNVLIMFCESWSNYLLTLHSNDVNLLCGMDWHLKEDILFRNYQSVCNGTVASIENLSVSTPFPRFFMSKYKYSLLPTSMALPFRKSGYTCEFITGMDQAWENCGVSLKRQGFERITGKYELLAKHPEYAANCIGIYDEYLLNSVYERLNGNAEKPQMLFCMTTTNHPPFELPEDADLPPLPGKFLESDSFEGVDAEVVEKYIRTFQYFNKCLAGFLDRFKASPAAKNTILVITGDHNVRTILNYNNIGGRWKNSVPLYIYLPPYLRDSSYPKEADKYGCHYCIMPTIAPFAFRDAEYLHLGKNLLDDNAVRANTYSYNEQQTLADDNYKATADKKAAARMMLLKLYLQMTFAHS